MVSAEDRRKERLNTMQVMADKKKTKAQIYKYCALNWGVSERTFNEYCKILEIK